MRLSAPFTGHTVTRADGSPSCDADHSLIDAFPRRIDPASPPTSCCGNCSRWMACRKRVHMPFCGIIGRTFHSLREGVSMMPERSQQVTLAFEAARELDTERRRAFLATLSSDDPSLCSEVETLLTQDAAQAHTRPSPSGAATYTGTRIGDYRIVG